MMMEHKILKWGKSTFYFHIVEKIPTDFIQIFVHEAHKEELPFFRT